MSELLAQEFFAPASADLVDTVVAQYRAELAKLDRICDVMADGLAGTMHYFIAGNGDERGRNDVERAIRKPVRRHVCFGGDAGGG